MTPAMPAPQAEFTPYLLQQAGLRASLLQRSFGYAYDDWEDLRQDLALDCVRRLPRFDSTRGDWKGFVRGVVRNHSCNLASRRARHPQWLSLEAHASPELGDGIHRVNLLETHTGDLFSALDLALDVRRVLARLPEEPRTLAGLLSELPAAAVRRKTGLTVSQLNRRIKQIRQAFLDAGLAPAGWGGSR